MSKRCAHTTTAAVSENVSMRVERFPSGPQVPKRDPNNIWVPNHQGIDAYRTLECRWVGLWLLKRGNVFLHQKFSDVIIRVQSPMRTTRERVRRDHRDLVIHGPIRSTARRKKWATLCGTFCAESLSGICRPLFPACGALYIFVW
jgi:hypothetical protein